MEIAREFLENSMETTLRTAEYPNLSEVPNDARENHIEASPQSSSSYTLATDQSVFSRDVEQWIRGSISTPTETGIQGSRPFRVTRAAVVQRSTLATEPVGAHGVWYFLALLLPLFSFNNCPYWRCSPSMILNTAELLFSNIGRACSNLKVQLRRLATNRNFSRELFATAMDTVLVIYAIGFLILSMFQAAVIG